jgi:hypothetical protein
VQHDHSHGVAEASSSPDTPFALNGRSDAVAATSPRGPNTQSKGRSGLGPAADHAAADDSVRLI